MPALALSMTDAGLAHAGHDNVIHQQVQGERPVHDFSQMTQDRATFVEGGGRRLLR